MGLFRQIWHEFVVMPWTPARREASYLHAYRKGDLLVIGMHLGEVSIISFMLCSIFFHPLFFVGVIASIVLMIFLDSKRMSRDLPK